MKKLTRSAWRSASALRWRRCGSGPAAIRSSSASAGPITGSDAAFGAQLKNGAEQAIADINEAGGILGKKIAAVRSATTSPIPKQGVSVANKFAADGVKFVVGHFNSGVTMPASEVYQENGILEITPASTNPQVTERNMWNIFRTCGRDDQQGAVAGDYIAEHFKGKKVAIVHDKTTYGQGLADETKKTMNAKGVKEVLYEGVNAGEKDFSALVSKIKASGADLVYWGGLHTAGGLIVRQMRDQGVNAPLMGGDGITSDEFAAIGGPGVEGTLMTYGPDPRKRPGSQGRGRQVPRQEFRARGLHALQLCRACRSSSRRPRRRNRSIPRRSPRSCIPARKFSTVIGDISYDKKGDVTRLDYVMYVWKKDASGKITYAGDRASKPVHPMLCSHRKGLHHPVVELREEAGEERHAGQHQQPAHHLLHHARDGRESARGRPRTARPPAPRS